MTRRTRSAWAARQRSLTCRPYLTSAWQASRKTTAVSYRHRNTCASGAAGNALLYATCRVDEILAATWTDHAASTTSQES